MVTQPMADWMEYTSLYFTNKSIIILKCNKFLKVLKSYKVKYEFIIVTCLSITVAYFIASRKVKSEAINKKKELTFAMGSLAVAAVFMISGAKGNTTTQANNSMYGNGETSNIVGPLWKVSDEHSMIYGVTGYLEYLAKEQGKSIIGMYDVYEAFEDLSHVSNEVEDANVKLMEYHDSMLVKSIEVLEYWKIGDVEHLIELMKNPYSVPDDKKDELNKLIEVANEDKEIIQIKQNKVYSSKIDGYMKENKNYFLAVSTEYIGGENGLGKMLEDRGYKVERITEE